MERINHTLSQIPKSGIRRFFDIVSEMDGAVSLGVGEPDFTTPWYMCDAAIYSIEKGKTHYSSNWGTKELRREVAYYLQKRFSVDYNPDNQILITVGASEGIDLTFRTILNPGDEVLIPDPSYVSYSPAVQLAGGVPVAVKTSDVNNFVITPEEVRKHITPKTKAIILPYPNNPTGGVLTREQVETLAYALKDEDIFIVSDEIYAELTYTGERHYSIAEYDFIKDKVILLSGFSKCLAMTGWRIGYACGPRDVLEQMFKIHQYTMLCAPIMAQAAAQAGLAKGRGDGYSDIERMKREYNRRRRYIVTRLRDIGMSCFEPLGAFYAFPSISQYGMHSQEYCEKLLYEQRVAVVPGDAFGSSGDGFVRCSYASSLENINEALNRMEAFGKSLRSL